MRRMAQLGSGEAVGAMARNMLGIWMRINMAG